MHAMQVSVEKDAGSDIPDINMKKSVADSLVFYYLYLYCCDCSLFFYAFRYICSKSVRENPNSYDVFII